MMPRGEMPIMGNNANLSGVSCFVFFPDGMNLAAVTFKTPSNPALKV